LTCENLNRPTRDTVASISMGAPRGGSDAERKTRAAQRTEESAPEQGRSDRRLLNPGPAQDDTYLHRAALQTTTLTHPGAECGRRQKSPTSKSHQRAQAPRTGPAVPTHTHTHTCLNVHACPRSGRMDTHMQMYRRYCMSMYACTLFFSIFFMRIKCTLSSRVSAGATTPRQMMVVVPCPQTDTRVSSSMSARPMDLKKEPFPSSLPMLRNRRTEAATLLCVIVLESVRQLFSTVRVELLLNTGGAVRACFGTGSRDRCCD
jgi:hypothetical protein